VYIYILNTDTKNAFAGSKSLISVKKNYVTMKQAVF